MNRRIAAVCGGCGAMALALLLSAAAPSRMVLTGRNGTLDGGTFTTASTSYATLASATITQDAANQPVIIHASIQSSGTNTAVVSYRLSYDGAVVAEWRYPNFVAQPNVASFAVTAPGSATAGSKTVLLEWKVSSGTQTGTYAVLSAETQAQP